MSVRFDLTAITPQLMDAVIYMDNSPSYAAFKEEIEAILSDFNATGHLSSSWKINEQELTEKSEDTLKNMHRAYLIWSYNEEQKNGADPDCCCAVFTKLFFKSQADTIIALNGGRETVGCDEAKALIESFKNEINSNPAVFSPLRTSSRATYTDISSTT